MSFPATLLKELQQSTNFDSSAFEQAQQQAAFTSIRLNPHKKVYQAKALEPVPWADHAYYLAKRPDFTLDPMLHGGAYYVQEASSMFLQQALQQHLDLSSALRVLDLCAAPGGKSTHIASLLTPESILLSNEVIATRATILNENICKWGLNNTWISHCDPQKFVSMEAYFDALVVDAPCSGSGLFRKDADAIQEWSEQNVNLCAQRQKRILHDALPSLKPDGVLVYMTCSFSAAENEDICDYILEQFDMDSLVIKLNPDWHITESYSKKGASAYRFYPHQLKGEGFFLACFKKKQKNVVLARKHTTNPVKPDKKINESVEPWYDYEGKTIIQENNNLFSIHQAHQTDYKTFQQHKIKLIKKGTLVGELGRQQLIPSHELALSIDIKKNLASCELSLEQALAYLGKHNFTVSQMPMGWVLMRYQGLNLGWIKNIGNRFNNYYPSHWRIRKNIDL